VRELAWPPIRLGRLRARRRSDLCTYTKPSKPVCSTAVTPFCRGACRIHSGATLSTARVRVSRSCDACNKRCPRVLRTYCCASAPHWTQHATWSLWVIGCRTSAPATATTLRPLDPHLRTNAGGSDQFTLCAKCGSHPNVLTPSEMSESGNLTRVHRWSAHLTSW
jgi:hypothetical protein